MGAPAPAPRKRTAAKKAAPKKATAPAGAGAAPAVPAPPPGAVPDGLSVNQWLHDLRAKPLRIEVFDRWWEFKQPTGAAAVTWDALLATKGIRYALASMMLDETASPELRWTDAAGTEHVLESVPGSARADEFVTEANKWLAPKDAAEFWRRIERAIFDVGEASAS